MVGYSFYPQDEDLRNFYFGTTTSTTGLAEYIRSLNEPAEALRNKPKEEEKRQFKNAEEANKYFLGLL